MSSATAPQRSLWPKEHGAYAQLFVPLVSAFVVAWPGISGLLWAVTASLVFAMHEPALVLLGRRGQRAQTQAGPRARTWLLVQGLAAAAATGAMIYLTPSILPVLGLVTASGLIVLIFVAKHAEKSALGEVAAAAALSGTGLTILVLADMPLTQAALHWGAWALGFMAVTAGVRGVIGFHRGRTEPWTWPLLAISSAACLGGAVAQPIIVAAAPLIVTGWALRIVAPRPRYLRTIGVLLVFASLATGALLMGLTRFPVNGPL